ncbi:MAG TPA: hypothetical protein VHE54_08235 [Puia sp.]|nr:hypothetical protein [Puia sp.]
MPTEEILIRQVKRLFEEKTGWGDSEQWNNQDFLQLSEMIRDQTGVTISHVTLKRIWGKVRYESLPNTHTLNTLVQFVGYDSWREFSVKHSANGHTSSPARETATPDAATNGLPLVRHLPETGPTNGQPPGSHSANGHTAPAPRLPDTAHGEAPFLPPPSQTGSSNGHPVTDEAAPTNPKHGRGRPPRKFLWFIAPLAVLSLILLFLRRKHPAPQPQDYAFSSKKVVTSGVPNSVVFDYDASRAPEDSVVIQQSWDTTRRVKVSKNGHQYTAMYYYPDFFHATLQVQNKVVKTHNLLIETNGWVPIVHHQPVPVYFKPEEAIVGGKMSLPVSKIAEKNIPMQPDPPSVWFCNVRDFGDIYSDHFTFETSLKNDYSDGSAACQTTMVYLLCEGTAIWVPLSAKGCISDNDLYFTYYYASGKHVDLSAFGVDFSKYVRLRIESDSGRARIFVNERLAYTVPRHILHSKIIGIDFNFKGTGSVDYVSLSNGKVNYRDDF